MSKDDDTRSIQSTLILNSQTNTLETSMAQARFTNFDDQLFQYIYSFKMHEAKNSSTNLGILLSLQTFQGFFQPLKRSDITSIGFQTVLKKIGLYFDPSFYLPSNTTLVVFFILFSLMFFSTVFIGFIMTAFNKKEKKVPEDLQSFSQQLIWITLFISPGVMYNIMTRPLNCIIHLDKVFGEYCNPKFNQAEAIIGIIIMIMALIFSFIVRLFLYEPLMHTKFIVASRDGIFNGWLLVVQNLNNVIQTILVEENPLYSAIIHIIIYGLYGLYVIIKPPYKMISGNQLTAVCLWISASGGIVSLILTPLNALSSMGSIGLKVLANIIFYLSIIIIVVISAFAAYIFVERASQNQWAIKPVTILRETKPSNSAELNKEVFNLKKKILGEQITSNSAIPQTPRSYQGTSSIRSTVTNISVKTSLNQSETTSKITNKKNKKIKLKEITIGFSVMMGEGEEIGYILNPVLEEEPEQIHQHLGAQKHTIRMLTKEHDVNQHLPKHHNGDHSHGHHSVKHFHEHEHYHHSGSITPHHLGDHSVHSHLGSPMLPLSQQSTLGQSSEKSLSLKNDGSSLSKTWADIPRDSFEITYVNDYPTYVWAPDLSSHPELLMATYPLKPNIQLNKSVLKPYKTVLDLDQSLMYLQNESLAASQDVLKFTDSLYASFLHKEEFIHSAELHIAYAFFLQDFRPAMQLKLLAHLQKACEYFPGWTSRWVVYRLMRQAEESMESGKGINQKQNGISESGGNKSSAFNSGIIDSKQRSINFQLQQAFKQYEISKAHLTRVWSLLTRRSVDVDKVEHHIRIASQNARLAQEQYNTLLIAHSENPNILRQYSVLMRDLYGDDRLAIEMLGEADLMEQENKIDLMKNEDEKEQDKLWVDEADHLNEQQDQKENESKDDNIKNEEGKTFQKSDSISDGN
ncbi:MAG: hypothetical protein EZS28_003686, partial [Streblomastix strix]